MYVYIINKINTNQHTIAEGESMIKYDNSINNAISSNISYITMIYAVGGKKNRYVNNVQWIMTNSTDTYIHIELHG